MISAGEMDRQIELQHDTPTTDPIYNEPISSFATYATVWAKMEFLRAAEAEALAREYADYGLFFTIRWRPDVEPDDRIVYAEQPGEPKNYEIIGRPREIGRRQGLKIQARLIE